MRILFALPGLHRYNRGAEIAFLSVAKELATSGDSVTLIGSGPAREEVPYRYLQGASVRREIFDKVPPLPLLRTQYVYEELTFMPSLMRLYRPTDYDVTVTCSYPFTNWLLRRPELRGFRPPHVFVTQNGDWPAQARNSEYRFFGCEGLVCINPDFYERNRARWRSSLIPNGVDINRFRPDDPVRGEFGLPEGKLLVLMVSALIPSKRVGLAIDAVSLIPDAHLVVAGDGPLRTALANAAADRLPGRFTQVSISPAEMPKLYQSADVFLHMSKDEPFGNVYLEAMACGLPVVAHESPRSRWILGDDEFLTDTDDTAAVAQQILRAYQSRTTTPHHHRAKKAVAFSWPMIAASYRSFLQEVISSEAPAR
jgi:glycosyltransferase involved in cell wall biosynthesis